MSFLNLKFRKAISEDENQVLDLVNSVYRARGPRQWTTEEDLVSGPRINNKIFNECVSGNDTVILLVFMNEILVGCVHLKKIKNKVNLGMLSINGEYQQYGIGAKLLAYAEEFVRNTFCLLTIEMQVISARTELINWYIRKGYVDSGELIPFRNHAESQNYEKDQSLYFKVFRKTLLSPTV